MITDRPIIIFQRVQVQLHLSPSKYQIDVISSKLHHICLLQWNMTCEYGPTKVRSVQSILMTGFMLGAFPFGWLGDWIGRYKVMIICHFFFVLFASASSFAVEYYSYALLR